MLSPPTHDVVVWESVLAPALLDALTRTMRAAEGRPADVRAPTGRLVDQHIRRTSRVEVPQSLSDKTRLCFEGLHDRLEEHFGVRLGGCEPPQFLRYERGDRFVPHSDVAAGRRVTAVLHLAQAGAARGSLTFFAPSPTASWQTCRKTVSFPPGSVIAFPADLVHEVPPVRVGPRLTVVTWFWNG